ncbi:FAD-dependent oxidoreductase [Roseomonas sp. NAR14]|uniref:FAD-dependent oxidoreductase n=1 Tax=Roseomonas acroporae TaxID=2937791 RepID=A0A9X2BXW7_9PROT|nr:FAD-dependent oxidoreductase [Roseomonas acroporae]MCK8787721.1 FAD-dependent oxidoreductase [Roseomonas acroporae]
MAETESFDAVVLGSGEAGKYMAWHLGKAGQRVAVVEGRYLGGSCPNIACLPSKNIIHGAAVAHTVATAAAFGTHATGFAVSMREVQARRRAMVDGLIALHRERFAAAGNELVWGHGRFVGERTLEVALPGGGVRRLRGDRVFLDLGAFATVPDLPGLVAAAPLTHVELLEIETLPAHLLVLGGGYIALELAQAMRRLGAAVTVVERAGRLLPREDPDIADEMRSMLAAEGIACITDADVQRVSGRSGGSVSLHGTAGGRVLEVTGSHLLVALGKAPNTAGIGLEEAGVALTPAGHVRVNERLETTADAVWAMGDCAGSPAFTHMSFEDFRIVRDNLAGGDRVTTGRQVPYCLFTEPEMARVGLNETEARQQGIAYRLATLPAAAILRTRTTGETRGRLKALVGADDRILGFTALAPHAGELLPPVQLAMAAGLPYRAVERLVVAHPTYAEGLVGLFGAVPQPG